LLKIGASRASKSGGRIYTNPVSVAGYFIFAFVAFISIYAMKGLDMKVFFALNSLTYICIPLLAYLILKESFTKNKIIGIIIISIGVIIFNL
jgi:drug/metabolite transporter (DMT)-like permease